MRNSLDRAADERELTDAIWLLVLTESYRFNRTDEYTGLPRAAVVAKYLDQNPEMKRFVERHIEAGTCAQGARDLRERAAEWSAAYRQSLPPMPRLPPKPQESLVPIERLTKDGKIVTEFQGTRSFLQDWKLRTFHHRGPARDDAEPTPTAPTEAQSEGPAEAGEASRQRRALSPHVFAHWWNSFPADAKPGSRQVNSWAAEQGYSTTDARKLFQQMPDRREPGRPKKRA